MTCYFSLSAFFLIWFLKAIISIFSAARASVRSFCSSTFASTCYFWYSWARAILSTVYCFISRLISRISFFIRTSCSYFWRCICKICYFLFLLSKMSFFRCSAKFWVIWKTSWRCLAALFSSIFFFFSSTSLIFSSCNLRISPRFYWSKINYFRSSSYLAVVSWAFSMCNFF